ncbi:MAG: endonuclease/exonuclease/phosphatase family protein, partial [Verrucomicrobiae bacterium]|nr:endonuclease/exonuclease/phosphatase family protein [Verrucomicrobiae bacterium]
ALLTRFKEVARDPHTDLEYGNGHPRLKVKRGFLEADLQVAPKYRLKVFVAHLKSKLAGEVPPGGLDEAAMRAEEARLLGQCAQEDLQAQTDVNLLVAGDLNDTPKSEPLRRVLGVGLFDLCPRDDRGYVGTYYSRWSRRSERIDYLLLSPGLRRDLAGAGRLRDDKTARTGSDHFALEADFSTTDR